MSKGIEGKVVLMTGGSTGIGAAVARRLAASGAKVAVAARRKDKLDEVVAAIVAEGGAAKAYARAIAYAIGQPDDVDINEIVLRPTSQEF
jgi:NADP-dependent 3-hydroxy acid dehydrogenase YdfG